MNPPKGRRLIHGTDGLNNAAWPMDANQFVTPTDDFFMRNHAPIPRVEADTWRLEVGGMIERPCSFCLDELRARFSRHAVTATLVCAGLRREEFLSLGPLPGELSWGPEPVSTGHWSGFRLRDLLESVRVSENARHVEFVGLDRVERHEKQFGFGGSIELDKAMGEEVILADRLNGEELTVEHGFPLRAVVPGWIGARSVKWLGRITLIDKPSDNYFQSKAYRVQRELNPADPRDVSAGVAMTEVPVNAVFIEPVPGQRVCAGAVRVSGWAMGGGGRQVESVEVSSDGGEHWREARVRAGGEDWAWIIWEAELQLCPGRHTLSVRATDSSGACQQPSVEAGWNVKGYGNNAWHRVTVIVE